MKKSRELGWLKLSIADTCKPQAKGSHQDHSGKFAKSVQFALKDEEFKDMIPIYSDAALSD